MLGHMLPWWLYRSLLTSRLGHIHHTLLILHLTTTIFLNILTHFYAKKTFFSKRKIRTRIFLMSKPLEFCHTNISNHVNPQQKRIEGILFWLIKTVFKAINLRIKVYSKIRHYFLNNQIAQKKTFTFLSKTSSVHFHHSIYIFKIFIIFISNRNQRTHHSKNLECSTLKIHLENKAIFNSMCNWMIILQDLHLYWMSFFNHLNSWYNRSNNELLIKILHSLLSRNINIMDYCCNKNSCGFKGRIIIYKYILTLFGTSRPHA